MRIVDPRIGVLMACRVRLVMSMLAVLALSACDKHEPPPAPAASGSGTAPSPAQSAPPATAPTPAPAPVVTSVTRDFQAQLREVTASSRRAFGASSDMYGRASVGPSLQLTIALQDLQGSRLYRLRDGSSLRGVQDGSGVELLKGADTFLKPISGARSEFVPSQQESRNSATTTFQVLLPIARIPTQVRRISGEFRLELVTDDAERTLPFPKLEEMIEIHPGTTASVKMLDLEAPATASSGLQSGAWTGKISVEVRSTLGTPDHPTPFAQSVEVLDAGGSLMATLTRRDESTVGNTCRRRFSNEPVYASARSDHVSTAKAPASLRFRLFTGIEAVTVPFEFGPVDLVEAQP